MPESSRPALLARLLRGVPRRFRVPAAPHDITPPGENGVRHSIAQELAITIEATRAALAEGRAPGEATRRRFLRALAHLIEDAWRGDPVFQALQMRQDSASVREYAGLATQAERDRRTVIQAVNAIAHPEKLSRTPPGAARDALTPLQDAAAAAAWDDLARAIPPALQLADADTRRGLDRLIESGALDHLRRLAALESQADVQQYRALWDRQGPRTGTAEAASQGQVARARGEAVEALTADALTALARCLAMAEDMPQGFRVVTSLRVPAALSGSSDHAKTEWDAVLLQRAPAGAGDADVWDICLLAEAKASIDAATTDYPRLLRGLQLLAAAQPALDYTFVAREGEVRLRGASLAALGTDPATLAEHVVYCSDASADSTPRLLAAASRMQLLSNPTSLAYADGLAGGTADPEQLDPVWQQLLQAPGWHAMREQYAVLHMVRALLVHVDDLLAAAAFDGPARAYRC